MSRIKLGSPKASISAWVVAGFAGSSGIPTRAGEPTAPMLSQKKPKKMNDRN